MTGIPEAAVRKRVFMRHTRSKRRWVQTVTTISTAPPPGTFSRSAQEIADIMAKPEVSPKGLGSGIRMIQYFINRGGRNLTPHRRRQLERAKRILQRRLASRESRRARTAQLPAQADRAWQLHKRARRK